jgi:hypothetical protein
MSLAETRAELVESLQDNLSVLLNPIAIADAGVELEEAALWFEALGICNLLIFADADRFYENLVKSGHTRRYFLQKSRQEGNTADYQLAISRWDSFLDVLVVGHFALARDIVALSGDSWVAGGEYEDDFCYRHFLHRFVMPPSPERDAVLQATLERWQAWLDGKDSSRLDCCKALLARDGQAFADAFHLRIVERQAEVARHRKMAIAADIAFLPRSQVFIEGLALLKLAERLGFSLRPDYPLCPALARIPPSKPLPDDLFPELEAARAQEPDED